MEQSTENPIATRTRSQQSTTQHMASHESTPTERQEIKEEFSKMNVDAEEADLQQQENSMQQTEDNTHSASSIFISRNNEMKNEYFNNFSNTSSQLHHLQETFAMKLTQK